MFRNEILSKSQWIAFDCSRFGHGVAGCIGLAYRIAQMYLCAEARRQMVLHIALPDLAHGDSSGPVAYLKDARLEPSLECRRREGKNGLLLQAYAYPSLRAGGLSCPSTTTRASSHPRGRICNSKTNATTGLSSRAEICRSRHRPSRSRTAHRINPSSGAM